jgi:ATP-grasp domain, R2K clade family 2
MQNSPPLVVLAPRVTDDSVAIWKAAIDAGWSVERLANWRVTDRLRTRERDIALYAEPLFAEAIADQLGLALIEPPANWLTTIPPQYLRREVRFCLLSDAQKLKTPTFVKPAEGKVFDAQVFASGDALPKTEQIGDIPVITSTPVSWLLEVRCFVLERQVVTMSPYWRNGVLAQSPDGDWPFEGDEEADAQDFMSTLLAEPALQLPPACVLDIGIIEDNGWAIIEANPCWGAGMYGCSPTAVLTTIRRAICPQNKVAVADVRWIGMRNRNPAS